MIFWLQMYKCVKLGSLLCRMFMLKLNNKAILSYSLTFKPNYNIFNTLKICVWCFIVKWKRTWGYYVYCVIRVDIIPFLVREFYGIFYCIRYVYRYAVSGYPWRFILFYIILTFVSEVLRILMYQLHRYDVPKRDILGALGYLDVYYENIRLLRTSSEGANPRIEATVAFRINFGLYLTPVYSARRYGTWKIAYEATYVFFRFLSRTGAGSAFKRLARVDRYGKIHFFDVFTELRRELLPSITTFDNYEGFPLAQSFSLSNRDDGEEGVGQTNNRWGTIFHCWPESVAYPFYRVYCSFVKENPIISLYAFSQCSSTAYMYDKMLWSTKIHLRLREYLERFDIFDVSPEVFMRNPVVRERCYINLSSWFPTAESVIILVNLLYKARFRSYTSDTVIDSYDFKQLIGGLLEIVDMKIKLYPKEHRPLLKRQVRRLWFKHYLFFSFEYLAWISRIVRDKLFCWSDALYFWCDFTWLYPFSLIPLSLLYANGYVIVATSILLGLFAIYLRFEVFQLSLYPLFSSLHIVVIAFFVIPGIFVGTAWQSLPIYGLTLVVLRKFFRYFYIRPIKAGIQPAIEDWLYLLVMFIEKYRFMRFRKKLESKYTYDSVAWDRMDRVYENLWPRGLEVTLRQFVLIICRLIYTFPQFARNCFDLLSGRKKWASCTKLNTKVGYNRFGPA